MTANERHVLVNRTDHRIWEKGEGEPVGYLAGFGGLPRWSPFLERLSRSRRVVVPSLPGFPGGGQGHFDLDDLPDYVAMTLDLLEGAGLEGADLIGASLGGMLAAEVAAFSRSTVRRLVLVAPLGLYDVQEPTHNPFHERTELRPSFLSANPDAWAEVFAAPTDSDEAAFEWEMEQRRAAEAAARQIWPFGDRGLAKRLHRITAPTLLVWGTEDRLVPASYAKRFADGIRGPSRVVSVAGAGHLADIDAPDEVAEAVESFLASVS